MEPARWIYLKNRIGRPGRATYHAERTGLAALYLQQSDIFGEAVRCNEEETWNKINLPVQSVNWSEQTISIDYLALVDHSKVVPSPDILTEECSWWSVEAILALLFDHNNVIGMALKSLRRQLSKQTISHLLPETFTIPKLQRLYETILGHLLDARNFYKKMIAQGQLERLAERRVDTPHKAPFLYLFKPQAA